MNHPKPEAAIYLAHEDMKIVVFGSQSMKASLCNLKKTKNENKFYQGGAKINYSEIIRHKWDGGLVGGLSKLLYETFLRKFYQK